MRQNAKFKMAFKPNKDKDEILLLIYKLLYGPILILVGPELIILGPFCVFTLSLYLLAPLIVEVAPLKKVGTYFFKWPHI